MAFLRPAILKDIHQALNNTKTHINSYDFEIRNTEGNIRITYNYKEGVFFEINFGNREEEYQAEEESSRSLFNMETAIKKVTRKGFLISGSMSPGQLTTIEEFSFYGVPGISKNIAYWVTRIWDDLSSDPIVKGMNQTQKDLENFLKQFPFEDVPNSNEYYSKQEVDEIKEKLNEVEKTLTEELKRTIEDKEALKKELADLKKEFNSFKQTASTLSKKNWVKSTLAKLYIWASKKENQKLISATAQYGKKLIDSF